jgi:DNA-binding MarR family transcriptional regulator
MKLQEAIKTEKFRDSRHMASLNLIYTAYWLRTHTATALKEVGFTAEQFNVMRILRGRHPEAMCVRDIASRMLETNSNVPRIIDRLVVKKWVKRATSKHDKRETLMKITEDGLEQLELANKKMEMLNEKIVGITEEQAQQLNDLLESFRKID